MQSNPKLFLTDIENNSWFLSSNNWQRLKNLLGLYGKILWTCPKKLEPTFHLLLSVYAAANEIWYSLAKKRLQTEFGLVCWLHRWQNSLNIIDKNYNISCETYHSRRPGFWLWVCLQIHLLILEKMSGGGDTYLFGYIGQRQESKKQEVEPQIV